MRRPLGPAQQPLPPAAVPGRGQHRRGAGHRARKREMMLAMATGTGKTFTLVNQIYRLMGPVWPGVSSSSWTAVPWLPRQCGPSPRSSPSPASSSTSYEVYSQRFHRDDFDEDEKFDPKVLPDDYLTTPSPATPSSTSAPSSAWPSTSSAAEPSPAWRRGPIDDDADRLDIPIHAFDLIIADECHRGYTAAGTVRLAQHPRPLRRDQDRPDRHAGRPH